MFFSTQTDVCHVPGSVQMPCSHDIIQVPGKEFTKKTGWEKPGHHTALYRYLISHLISAGKSDVKSLFSPVSLQPLTRN